MASTKSVKELADKLISTLSTSMPGEQADAIVRDVAEELYNDVLNIPGKIVPTMQGIAHGSFGKGQRAIMIAEYKFEPKEQ